MPKIPERYQKDVIDLLQQISAVLVTDLKDLNEGLLYYEIDANIPSSTMFTQAHKRRPSLAMEALYRKMQEHLIDSGLFEPAVSPKFVHPFSLIPKGGATFPATAEEVEKMTYDFIRRNFRVIMDASFLTMYCKENSIGFSPEAIESICKLRDEVFLTFFDVTSAFHQVNLSNRKNEDGICVRDLFGTFSYIIGILYQRN